MVGRLKAFTLPLLVVSVTTLAILAAAYATNVSAHSVQFTDTTGDKELIISAWPYTQLDLTLGRLGEPSNTADQPDHLEIVDVLRDDVFKVLFTKNGTLYVVTTLPEYEAWLTDILTTWQFLE